MKPQIFIEGTSWNADTPFTKHFDGEHQYPYGVNVELYYTGGNVETRYNCTRVSYELYPERREGNYVLASSGCSSCKTSSMHSRATGKVLTSKLQMIRIKRAHKLHT